MRPEKTPEERARSKRANANVMIVAGVVMTACGLAGALILLSGRADAPDWVFGGSSTAVARRGSWSDTPNRLVFSEWGRAPFLRAARENKLVLMYLGPSYGATTARLESELFADPDTAEFVLRRFIPVRVKSEISPDLDRRFRAGGWPTIAILFPNGALLDAAVPASAARFRAWARALSDQALAHPQLWTTASDPVSTGSRRYFGRSPATAREADAAAQAALMRLWDGRRRTFDRRGPRYPRFERVAALSELNSSWARELAAEAVQGLLIFQDPADGGFWRMANPDGSPAALEKRSAEQSGALNALCSTRPDFARRALSFLDRDFQADAASRGWKGWLSGWAFDPEHYRATDGDEFEAFSRSGMREFGRARIADNAELAKAVLACAVATRKQKDYARRAAASEFAIFQRSVRANGEKILLEDAAALGDALLEAGDARGAYFVFEWMEKSLADGPAYFDRLATGVLRPEFDRVADPVLNARAEVFVRRLAARASSLDAGSAAAKRSEALRAWLTAHAQGLDPAVWASIAAAGSLQL